MKGQRNQEKDKAKECPYNKASWLSKATFWWMNPLFRAGRKFTLTKDDVYDVMPTDDASLLSDRLQRFWEAEIEYSQRKKKEPNLFKTVLLTFRNECLYFGIFLFFSESMRLIQPYLIGQMIGYFQPGSALTHAEVYLMAVALSVSGILRLMLDPCYFFQAHYLAMRMKVAVGSLIYRKVLKISSLSLHKTNSGQIINYLSTDLEKFNFTPETFHFIWLAPLEVVIIIMLIYSNLGPACLFMIPVFVCIVPFQSLFGRLFGKLRIKIAAGTDRRIHMMNEIIAGMKAIKMYCWEKPFGQLIAKLRYNEVKYLWYASMARVWNICLYLTGSRLVLLAVFVSAWQMDVPLTSTVVFSTMGWIECLRLAVFLFLFLFVENNVQLFASLKRIKEFLIIDEMEDMTKQCKNSRILYTRDSKTEYSIDIDQMTAVWTPMIGLQSTEVQDNKVITQSEDTEQRKLMSIPENVRICILLLYHNPSNTPKEFLPELETLLQTVPQGLPCIALGDFNIDILCKGPSKDKLLGLFRYYGYVQLCDSPTHRKGGLLDHLYINRLPDGFDIDVVPTCYSDHFSSLPPFSGKYYLNKYGEEMTETFSVKNINLKVKRATVAPRAPVPTQVTPKCVLPGQTYSNILLQGELIAVVGAVGSGKSSLLMTLLGELPAVDGKITVNGTLGYVSQQPWVVTGTLRDNVLFGEIYDETKYQRVINVCALDKDMEQMRHGDQTLVGERGLLLSGGQKARLTLARCIYKDVDIYMLDDPLGAVDTEVGRHLFNKCICEYLEDKTRILVTHQLQFLSTVDKIILLKEGSVVSVGSYNELTNSEELFKVLSDMHSEENDEIEQVKGGTNTLKASTDREEVEEEDIQSGTVGWGVYREYIAAAYPKLTVPLLLILVISLECSFICADWHLAKWAENQDVVRTRTQLRNIIEDSNISSLIQNDCVGVVNCQTSNPALYDWSISATMTPVSNVTTHLPHNEYMYIYIVSFCVFFVLAIIMSGVFYTTLITAGKRLHDRMFNVVIGAKTAFFDSNPVGRILNRFARDVGVMDDNVPRIAFVVFEIGFRLTGLFITTCVINPLLLIPLCPLLIYVILIRNYAVKTTRHLKRIESVAKSPVYSHVSDTLHGLQSIRALNLSKDFIQQFDSCQNQHTSSAFLFLASLRWFGVRSLFGVFVYFIWVIIMSLILKDVIGLTGGLYGLSLNYVMVIADPFEFFVRQSAEVETYMTSVERITAYTKLEQEADKISNNPPRPPWPRYGEIVCEELSLKYSSESPTVLKNINFTIQAREKIGIVGRTGAGKSSLLASLLRLAEPTGSLIIDGVDVLSIGLHELRAKISVIPQDPTLFSGTLRHNLDPFKQYEDEMLWKSLQQVQLKAKIEGMPGQLYAEVSEGGKNFSVGQRQLVCLARAVLNYNKILILDEATANVDRRTDELIQKTIREQFHECTVLTVAHRLHTIMDSDRVMVLDQGELKEFDIPYKLLQQDGYFRHLVDQTGKAQVQQLHALALEAYQQRTAQSTTSAAK